jgi:hypothetical protein
MAAAFLDSVRIFAISCPRAPTREQTDKNCWNCHPGQDVGTEDLDERSAEHKQRESGVRLIGFPRAVPEERY